MKENRRDLKPGKQIALSAAAGKHPLQRGGAPAAGTPDLRPSVTVKERVTRQQLLSSAAVFQENQGNPAGGRLNGGVSAAACGVTVKAPVPR